MRSLRWYLRRSSIRDGVRISSPRLPQRTKYSKLFAQYFLRRRSRTRTRCDTSGSNSRVGKLFLAPGFRSVFQEEENLRVSATKDAMLENRSSFKGRRIRAMGSDVFW